MMLFTFFIFDGNRTSWANLVEIVNIYSLRRNLIPRLIPLCRIQWQCFHLFLFQSETLFLGKFGLKCQNCEFKAKFGSQNWYSQIPHRSTRVSSTFCRWHMLRFDASYKEGKPFLPVLKLLVLTCVICCDQRLFFPDSVMFKDFLFLSVL